MEKRTLKSLSLDQLVTLAKSPPNPDDQQKVEMIKEEILRRFHPLLVKTALQLFPTFHPYHHEVYLAGQEQILEMLERYDPNRGTRFFTYVYAGLSKRMYREAFRLGQCSSHELPEVSEFDLEQVLEQIEFREEVNSVLQSLPPSYSFTLRALYLENRTYSEIAKELGISETYLRRKLSVQARKAFRAAWQKLQKGDLNGNHKVSSQAFPKESKKRS